GRARARGPGQRRPLSRRRAHRVARVERGRRARDARAGRARRRRPDVSCAPAPRGTVAAGVVAAVITPTSFSLSSVGSWLKRWPNGFIVAFVALQLLLPLHYYVA